MKKTDKKNSKAWFKKLIIQRLIPILFILFWFFASLFFNNKVSFSVLLYKQAQNEIKQVSSEKLLKGGKVSGEFKAGENYLGLVMLRFNNYVKHDYSSEDILLFKLKEKGASNWYYVNDYKSGLLENNLLFPFGFPVISNSKGKIYQFEIESLLGNQANAVEVNKNNFTFLTGYQFPKKEILSSKKAIIVFLVKKVFTSFTNVDFLLSSVLYSVPLILYITIYYISAFLERQKHSRFIPVGLVFALILIDIFVLKEVYFGVLISLTIGWIFFGIKNVINSKISFLLAFLLIIVWVVLILAKIEEPQNKINIWTYSFFVIGLFQAIFEYRKNDK